MESLDCVVIGGGPAGLTAAIYLARFRLSVTVIDAGASRAALIPCTRNHAGFPGGISGKALLGRMREQALDYGAAVEAGTVDRLERYDDGFVVVAAARSVVARTVLIATGVTNRRPQMPQALHDQALQDGRIRYCPVCDGYEVTDRKVAVIGTGARGLKEAMFLRAYTREVALAPDQDRHDFTAQELQQIVHCDIRLIEPPARHFALEDDVTSFRAGDERFTVDSVYPALGSDIHSDLAADLGADRTEDGCIRVDAHQRTSIPRLYAAGDVVIGLDQISHAMGEAGVAATTIRNDLAERAPLLR